MIYQSRKSGGLVSDCSALVEVARTSGSHSNCFILPVALCDGVPPPRSLGDMPVQEMAVSPVKSLYWEKFPPMSQRRVYCTPIYHEGLVYVLGGCSETGMPLDSAEVLDVESQTWSQLPPLPTARAGAAAVALGGQVMVLGGMNQQQTPLASVDVFHPDEGKWEPKASLGQPSMGVTTVQKGMLPLHEAEREQARLEICYLAFLLCGCVCVCSNGSTSIFFVIYVIFEIPRWTCCGDQRVVVCHVSLVRCSGCGPA